MGIFGFTWADAGAVMGATVGGAVLGPPGAMLGGALATYAGATLGDGKGTGQALEEAAVAGIGGAGGAWAADLGGKLLRDGLVRTAGKALSSSAKRRVDEVASKVLLPWNKYDASPIAALGGGFAAYEASPQSRSSSGSPVAVRITDIGNGGCPIEMTNLVMPEQLSASIEKQYRELPGYLCGVWRSFGTGTGTGPATPKPPTTITGTARSGIETYPGKVAELNASITEFATLERELAPLAQSSGEISARGQQAVTAVIARVDRGAATAPPPGPAADTYALGELDAAFASGQSTLEDAKRGNDRLADRIDALTRRIEKLGERVESGMKRAEEIERRQPIVVPAPHIAVNPPPATPWTPNDLLLPPEPSSEPSENSAPGLSPGGRAPIRIPSSQRNGTAPGPASVGTAIARPVPTSSADRPQPVEPQLAPGAWSTPWSTTSPRPKPGTQWMPGCTQYPDDWSNGRRKSETAVTIAAPNPQVTTAAWHTCRVNRSPCAERGAR